MSDTPEGGTGPNEVERILGEEIELRAYFKYRERGCTEGCDVDDWLAAEQEILAERAAAPPPRATEMSETPPDAAGTKGEHADAPVSTGRDRASTRSPKR